ncbi:UNVERIFIED_ORG: hypothetical protein E4P37_17840 [Bacillus sp. AZ43]
MVSHQNDDGTDPRDRAGARPTMGRAKARALILGVIAAIIVGIFLFILLVSQIGSDGGDVDEENSGSAAVVLEGAGRG